MTSNLTLAQKLQAKSAEQAKILEEAQSSALEQLKDSMQKSLTESESIIKKGIADLSLSSDELQNLLTQHLQNIQRVTDDTLEQYRIHIQTHLESEIDEIAQMIASYTTSVQSLIEQREQALISTIKNQMKPWLIWGSVACVILMILSAFIGAMIAKSVIDSPILIFKQDPYTKQNTFYRGIE